MITVNPLPKVYVVAQRLEAQEMISNELRSEPLEVIAARDAKEYFDIVDEIQEGCILVEVSMDPLIELNAIVSLRSKQKHMQIIAFGDRWNVANAVNAIKMGAREVCEFPGSGNELKIAIYKALKENRKGDLNLHERIPRSILDLVSIDESETLRLIVEGKTAKEVGASMDVSVRTFHYRKKSIFKKLNVRNRSEFIELIRRAIEKSA